VGMTLQRTPSVKTIPSPSWLVGADEPGQAVREHREAAQPLTFNANDPPPQNGP
jgi:hypothetical protein